MSFRRIVLVFLVLSRLIVNIMFSVYSTPVTLGLYTLIIYTGPLNVQIVITVISRLTSCYNYNAEPISLLTIKHIYITAFGLYRSWNSQGQYVNCIQVLQYGFCIARIQCFPRSKLSSRGLAKRQFTLPQLYCIIVKWRTPSKGPSALFLPSVFLFPLSLKCSMFLCPMSAPQLLLIF